MRVLSLFDGISCGYVALERAGIRIDKYYACEIDKYAEAISKKNYPNIERLGDVTKIDFTKLEEIDLVIGGSPCQGFSVAGKRLNFEDPRSKLFFEFVRAIRETKPKYFLLENVVMKKEIQDIISGILGVQPIKINSSLLSAQSRKRLYWTNIPIVALPEDKRIYLKDILEPSSAVDEKYFLSQKLVGGFLNKKGVFNGRFRPMGEGTLKSFTLTARYAKCSISDPYVYDVPYRLFNIGKGGQGSRVYDIAAKSVTLSAVGGGQGAKTGLYMVQRPRGYNKGETKFDEKCPTIGSSCWEHNNLLIDEVWGVRRLTPLECERLQTLPEKYTEYGDFNGIIKKVSDTQRYKGIGNGWTVDVITHIFKNIPIS